MCFISMGARGRDCGRFCSTWDLGTPRRVEFRLCPRSSKVCVLLVEAYVFYLHSFYACDSEIKLTQQVLLSILHVAVLTCAWLLDSSSSWLTQTINLDLSALNSGLVWGFYFCLLVLAVVFLTPIS